MIEKSILHKDDNIFFKTAAFSITNTAAVHGKILEWEKIESSAKFLPVNYISGNT